MCLGIALHNKLLLLTDIFKVYIMSPRENKISWIPRYIFMVF